MAKINSLFRPLDEAIFKAVDEIKNQPQFSKISDEIGALPEGQQKIISQVLSTIVVLLPLLIVFFLFNQNIEQKKNIVIKEEIIKLLTETSFKSNELALSSRHIVGTGVINSISDLQRLVKSSLANAGVSQDAITVNEFDQTNAGDSLTRTIATLNFTNLSTQNFTAVLRDLLIQQKMKISALQIEKVNSENYLQGNLEIYHFSSTQQ